MADLTDIDLDDLAMTLADQSQPYGDFSTLIDRATGELKVRANSVDDEDEDDLDDQPGLVQVDPIPSAVWYKDMVDFVDGINDERAARRLARALDGRGPFRRFRDQLHREDPALLPLWHAFSDTRGRRRAVEWLVENDIVRQDEAEAYIAEHPDPALS